MLSWGPTIRIHNFKSRNLSRGSLYRVELFVGTSPRPGATAKEPNELSPIGAGGEGIGRRTPAMVINNTMSNGHYYVPCD